MPRLVWDCILDVSKRYVSDFWRINIMKFEKHVEPIVLPDGSQSWWLGGNPRREVVLTCTSQVISSKNIK